MIFRAVFWIGLVSLLTPHEPDLGLGRPGAGTSQLTPAMIQSAATGLSRTGQDCGSACAGGLGALAGPLDGRRLAEMKLELAASIRARAQRRDS